MSLSEVVPRSSSTGRAPSVVLHQARLDRARDLLRDPSRPIGDIDPHTSTPRPTGIGELDRVLGGGIVPGAVTLLGGEPGIDPMDRRFVRHADVVVVGEHAALYYFTHAEWDELGVPAGPPDT